MLTLTIIESDYNPLNGNLDEKKSNISMKLKTKPEDNKKSQNDREALEILANELLPEDLARLIGLVKRKHYGN